MQASSIFPLRVSPFEAMLLAEDRPQFPQVGTVEIDLVGAAGRDVLAAAWRCACERHPLCRAVLERTGRRSAWIAAPMRELRWADAADFADARLPNVNLDEQPGAWLTAADAAAGTRLRLHVHHACSDGAGALQLLTDLLGAYANLMAGCDAEHGLPPRDAGTLPLRYQFPHRGAGWRRQAYDVFFGAREAAKFALQRPTSLAAAPNAAADGLARGAAASLAVRLSQDETAAVRRRAAHCGATVNELLIHAALGAAAWWNDRHGVTDPQAKYRLLVPCDLRTPEHAATPAANIIGYSFYTRTAAACRDAAALLQGVVGESAFIRNENAAMYFVRCLENASRMPGGVRLMSDAEGCYATLLASNAGDPWRMLPGALIRQDGRVAAGDVAVADVRGFSPLRPGTRAGVVAVTYQQRLGLGLRYDATHWDCPAAEAFLGELLRRLASAAPGDLNGS